MDNLSNIKLENLSLEERYRYDNEDFTKEDKELILFFITSILSSIIVFYINKELIQINTFLNFLLFCVVFLTINIKYFIYSIKNSNFLNKSFFVFKYLRVNFKHSVKKDYVRKAFKYLFLRFVFSFIFILIAPFAIVIPSVIRKFVKNIKYIKHFNLYHKMTLLF